MCRRVLSAFAISCIVRWVASQDDVLPPDPDANARLPSEEVCYASTMTPGCPGSLGIDSQRALCKCEYQSNSWFQVLTKFIQAFRAAPADHSLLAQKFDARTEGDGSLSLNVGYHERIYCGASTVSQFPGSTTPVNAMYLFELAGNFIYPQVQNALNDLCLPGRLALQLICLHAELLRKDVRGAKAYASQMEMVFPMVQGCLQEDTPWPFPGLRQYLLMWSAVTLPEDNSLQPAVEASSLWWPAASIRAKRPEESAAHYWPCAELKDPSCFPAGADNLFTSCAHCCDPAKGPTGDASCFIGEWTFARCCRTPGGVGRFY